jgi:protein arginine kinase activator
MKCDFCNKNEATIHLIKIQGSNVEKINICRECAKDFSFLNEEDFYSDLTKIFYKIFQSGNGSSQSGMSKKILKNLSFRRNLKCSICGTDLKAIKRTGKVGCGNCYSEFKDILFPVIKSIQGSLENKGKIPVNTSKKIRLEKSIKDLRYKLQSEIIIENFEGAAKIRDKIKRLEKNIYGR